MNRVIVAILIPMSLGVASATYSIANLKYSDSDRILMQNVEALSESEESKYNICFSQSKVAKGYTYYDCGNCKKVYDEKGKGGESKCFY